MILEYTRPNRFKDTKNEKYHIQYAKWVLSCVSMSTRTAFIYKSQINWAFYKGNQWLFHEDLDAFLLDESGDVRNRIKFVQNIIRPFVQYYTGSAIRMDISARATSISSQAVDRRQTALMRADAMYEMYIKSPDEFKGWIKEIFPVGDSKQENTDIANNLYKDKFEEEVNDIINWLVERNGMEDKKVQLIKHIVLDGIGILKEYERFGCQVVGLTQPKNFFFDESAKSPDLKDSEFMGDWSLCSISDIVEEVPDLSMTKKIMLEKSSASPRYHTGLHNLASFEYTRSNGKIPVYYIEWRDIETSEFGAVMNDNGVLELARIGDGKDKTITPYTRKDLIPKSELKLHEKDNFWIRTVLKGEQTAMISNDCVRYCKFVPSEFLSEGSEDFVLKYGLKEYVNKYSYNYKNPDWSYKIYCWSYDNGDIMSPIDDLISPQRFINRMLSMGESQINNFRGSGSIIDKNIIDQVEGEEGVQRSINLGKTIFVDGSVNNSVSTYGNTLGQGTIELFNVAQTMKKIADGIIGGGDALQGSGGAYRASATVNEQNLNQGTTMQEPVFYCLHRIILDTYESFANRGRRILCANQNRLTVTVGETGMKHITLTRDFDLEEYRMKVIRSNNPDQEKQSANQELWMLLQAKLITEEIFAKYYNRSTTSSIGMAMREGMQLKIEQQREQQKIQAQQDKNALVAAQAGAKLQNLQQDAIAAQEQQAKQQETSYGDAKLMETLLNKSSMEKSLE